MPNGLLGACSRFSDTLLASLLGSLSACGAPIARFQSVRTPAANLDSKQVHS